MLRGSLVYPEGIVDVGIIAIVCFDNPLKEYGVRFLTDVLSQKIRVAIPVSTIIGAYHIATRYLKVPHLSVKQILTKLLETSSPAFYPQIPIELAVDALEYATHYRIESWDGYLIALAKSIGNSIIYSLDRVLEKEECVKVINPFPEEKVKEYHEFLKKKLG